VGEELKNWGIRKESVAKLKRTISKTLRNRQGIDTGDVFFGAERRERSDILAVGGPEQLSRCTEKEGGKISFMDQSQTQGRP